MKTRRLGYSSDSEKPNKAEDLSIVRKPIHTALTGFMEAKKAYENGTDEIRRLLSRECDIIYECNVCRNIFRSFTNFINHKRVYCRTPYNKFHFNNNNGFIDQDISTIVQSEHEFINNNKNATHKSNAQKVSSSNKDLSSIIERLINREQSNRLIKLSDFYNKVNSKLKKEDVLKQNHVLQLDSVPNTSVAVYQTVKCNNNDNIKLEVTEVHDMLKNNRYILGSHDKVLPTDKPIETEISNNENVEIKRDDEHIYCVICNQQFSTEKTLKLHIQTKHIASTYVYKCPSCSLTYLQPSAVIRHLSSDHKKSLRRIRLLRETIYKKRLRVDEVTGKAHNGHTSRQLLGLQMDNKTCKTEKTSCVDIIELPSNSPICPYCGKCFDQKAVLITHLSNCTIKNQQASIPNLLSVPKLLEESKLNSNCILNNSATFSRTGTVQNVQNREIAEATKDSRRKRRKPPKIAIKNEDPDSDTLNEMFMNLGKETDKMTLNTVCLDNINSGDIGEDFGKVESIQKSDEIKIESIDQEPEKRSNENRKSLACFCKICQKRFDALSNLRRHISMFHYRSRKYGCKLCDYRAYRKYDVSNHLVATHSVAVDREMVLEFIEVHVDKYLKDDVNEDIGVITDLGEQETSEKKIETRQRRVKDNNTSRSFVQAQITKLTRSSSNQSANDLAVELPSTISPKRPIRNRIKPVNKDFVYDLSNLLKKDMMYVVSGEKEIPIGTGKRRSTILIDRPSRCSTPNLDSTTNRTKKVQPNVAIRGAAQRMTQLVMTENRAALGSPPPIPNDRPLIYSRLMSSYRSEEFNVPQKELPNLEVNYAYASLSDDSFISKFSKRRKLDLTITRQRSAISGESTITSLLNKVEKNAVNGAFINNDFNCKKNTINQHLSTKIQSDICRNLDTKQDGTSFVPSLPKESSQPPAPTKRITLLQRLAENKKHIQESLLRSTLKDS